MRLGEAVRIAVLGSQALELGYIQSIANHLRRSEERKSLILFCDDSTYNRRPNAADPLYSATIDALRALQAAHVAVYSVPCSDTPSRVAKRERKSETLASITGGRQYSSHRELSKIIEEAEADNRVIPASEGILFRRYRYDPSRTGQ